jgi:hypothetical protein
MQLPEHETELFEHFNRWLYTGVVFMPYPSEAFFEFHDEERARAHTLETWTFITRLYLLAQYFQSPAFGNDFLTWAPSPSEPESGYFEGPEPSVVSMVYEHTIKGCALRRYLVAWYVWKPHSIFTDDRPSWDQYLASLPAEYILDIATLQVKKSLGLCDDPFIEKFPGQCFQD